jgi:hypothetical protein
MKASFVLFFATFFILYGLVNTYIFIRGWQAIPSGSPIRPIYALVFMIVALSFIGGRLLENIWLSPVSDVFVWIGAFWIAAMLYFFLAILALDLLRFVHRSVPFLPAAWMNDYPRTKMITAVTVIFGVAITVLAGHVNALTPRIRTLELSIPKDSVNLKSLSIVSVSDIHLGTIIGRRRLERLVSRVNSLNPDLILLPGDIVDEDLAPVIKQNLGEHLARFKSTFGVYAIMGNHEYIGGAEEAYAYLSNHGVTVLRDRVIKLENSLYLVGREDRSMQRFTGRPRKPLSELMAPVDKRSPVILMDHQPFHLEEGENNGADLQISGHTHHGQLWPNNTITNLVYELSWGYRKRGNTHVYVSSGYGSWGPPVRTGNRPEIVNIRLRFKPSLP